MTEQLLSQQLESPSGTGRVEPRSQISLTSPANDERDTGEPANPFSLADMAPLLPGEVSDSVGGADGQTWRTRSRTPPGRERCR